jgi:hypothetical protein
MTDPTIPPMPLSFITEENARRLGSVMSDNRAPADLKGYTEMALKMRGFCYNSFQRLYAQDIRASSSKPCWKCGKALEAGQYHAACGVGPPAKRETRLERVAAGLERDRGSQGTPEGGICYGSLRAAIECSPLRHVKGINEKPPLTIQADDQTGEDVCGYPRWKL